MISKEHRRTQKEKAKITYIKCCNGWEMKDIHKSRNKLKLHHLSEYCQQSGAGR